MGRRRRIKILAWLMWGGLLQLYNLINILSLIIFGWTGRVKCKRGW
jgi:hypothetical protein